MAWAPVLRGCRCRRALPAGRSRSFPHDDRRLRKTVHLQIHREQSCIARLGLKRDGAGEAVAAQRVDRMRPDVSPDVDEHRVLMQASRRAQQVHRRIDLTALPAAMPHEPGTDHAVAGIDKEADIAKLAQHEMPARSERIREDLAQSRPADQNGLQHRLAQSAPATLVHRSDLTPGGNSRFGPCRIGCAGPSLTAIPSSRASPRLWRRSLSIPSRQVS